MIDLTAVVRRQHIQSVTNPASGELLDDAAPGIAVRLRGTWRHARLYWPGTGIDIDQRVLTIATLVIE